jgi:hypothetical protein
MGGTFMNHYDDKVLQCFLDNQLKLVPEEVAADVEEADEFLTDCMAVVVSSAKEVAEYFEEEGVDLEGMNKDELLEAEEVFAVGDGRYLIVEA